MENNKNIIPKLIRMVINKETGVHNAFDEFGNYITPKVGEYYYDALGETPSYKSYIWKDNYIITSPPLPNDLKEQIDESIKNLSKSIAIKSITEHENKIICFCGSMQIYDKMLKLAEKLTAEGKLILLPFKHPIDQYDGFGDNICESVHNLRIEICDEVYILYYRGNRDFLGNNTRKNIEYAMRCSKPIVYCELGKNDYTLIYE